MSLLFLRGRTKFEEVHTGCWRRGCTRISIPNISHLGCGCSRSRGKRGIRAALPLICPSLGKLLLLFRRRDIRNANSLPQSLPTPRVYLFGFLRLRTNSHKKSRFLILQNSFVKSEVTFYILLFLQFINKKNGYQNAQNYGYYCYGGITCMFCFGSLRLGNKLGYAFRLSDAYAFLYGFFNAN